MPQWFYIASGSLGHCGTRSPKMLFGDAKTARFAHVAEMANTRMNIDEFTIEGHKKQGTPTPLPLHLIFAFPTRDRSGRLRSLSRLIQ
jgi:hypothetical protein